MRVGWAERVARREWPGVTKNNAEAVRWYKLAAQQGDKDAKVALELLGLN